MPLISLHSQRGFTLIEVLVAALVLAIGILGLTTTMLLGLKSDQSAYYRSQASAMAYDMADRIRANRTAAASYNNVDTNGTLPSGGSCESSTVGCSKTERAAEDIKQWGGNFTNVNGTSGFKPKLPAGRGTVTRQASGRYLITISWSETDWNAANASQKSVGTESLSVSLTL